VVVGSDNDEQRSGREALHAALQRLYADAILRGDEVEAERVIRDAIDARLDQATIDEHIIGPAMRMVGDLWEDGNLTVADEHLATEITIRMLALQREAFRVARRRASVRVLLAAVEGERHVVGLGMVANLLLEGGYDVRMLGADVPLDTLPAALDRHEPAVVGLTVTMPSLGPIAERAVELIRCTPALSGVMLGGAGLPSRLRGDPRLVICRGVGDAVETVDALVQHASSN
jgi:MerR family transcriptional regulator, light-induced transcriptional regulator